MAFKYSGDASKDMGVLLLAGWAMLEDTCEQCYVPLMLSRDKKSLICTQCQTDFKNPGAPKPKPAELKVVNESEEFDDNAAKEQALAKLEEERQNVLKKRREENEMAKRAMLLSAQAKEQREQAQAKER